MTQSGHLFLARGVVDKVARYCLPSCYRCCHIPDCFCLLSLALAVNISVVLLVPVVLLLRVRVFCFSFEVIKLRKSETYIAKEEASVGFKEQKFNALKSLKKGESANKIAIQLNFGRSTVQIKFCLS